MRRWILWSNKQFYSDLCGYSWEHNNSCHRIPVGWIPVDTEHVNATDCVNSAWNGTIVKGKGKVHPRTGHEDPEGELRYSSTLPLTLALDGVGGRHALAALPLGRTRYPLYMEAGWAPRPVWTVAENLAPTGIRSPDRPARSEFLYWLSYPGPKWKDSRSQ